MSYGKKLDDERVNENWKECVGEKASRIWEWWRVRIHEDKNRKLHYFVITLRSVVMAQTSSCAVDMIFSRLKSIEDSCGENVREDMLEIRMFPRNNGDLNVYSKGVIHIYSKYYVNKHKHYLSIFFNNLDLDSIHIYIKVIN